MGSQKWMSAALLLCMSMAWGKEPSFFEKAKQPYTFVPVYQVYTPTEDGQDTIETRMDVAFKSKKKNMASLMLYTKVKQAHSSESLQGLSHILFNCRNQSISYGQSYVSMSETEDEVMPLDLQTAFQTQEQMLAEGLYEGQGKQERVMAIDLTQKMFTRLNEVACVNR